VHRSLTLVGPGTEHVLDVHFRVDIGVAVRDVQIPAQDHVFPLITERVDVIGDPGNSISDCSFSVRGVW